jgi:GNAT superfamily N-acetyltransferase
MVLVDHPDGVMPMTAPLIRPLTAADVPAADRIFRLAFGTFLGLPEPERFAGDAAYVAPRWQTDPTAAFAVDVDGQLAGSNFVSRWGSVGVVGPLTIHPQYWDRGLGRELMAAAVGQLERWGVRLGALFTFAQSPKHVGLYRTFGFQPRFLTTIMAKPVAGAASTAAIRYSQGSPDDRTSWLAACDALTDRLYGGLSLAAEVRAVASQDLGETLLVGDNGGLAGFAVCHHGAGTEAGSQAAYIKFAAVRSGADAGRTLAAVVAAVEAWAAERGATQLVAGTNTARQMAWDGLLAAGFRTMVQGVAMHRPNDPGYSHPEAVVLDDWR